MISKRIVGRGCIDHLYSPLKYNLGPPPGGELNSWPKEEGRPKGAPPFGDSMEPLFFFIGLAFGLGIGFLVF